MNAKAELLVLETVALLGKALDIGPRSRLAPIEIERLNVIVEDLTAHASDPLVKDTLHALIGADLYPRVAEKLKSYQD
ncbi:MAG: hypothetical protein ACREQR_14735 [Candidatus Binataceae bacterium]